MVAYRGVLRMFCFPLGAVGVLMCSVCPHKEPMGMNGIYVSMMLPPRVAILGWGKRALDATPPSPPSPLVLFPGGARNPRNARQAGQNKREGGTRVSIPSMGLTKEKRGGTK